MHMNKVLAVLIASLLLANFAYAANKTGVTDSLNAGDSRVDLTYTFVNISLSSTFTSGATSAAQSAKATGTQFGASYFFGLTDRLNLGVLLALSQNSSAESSGTSGSNSIVATSKAEGDGDPSIGAQYLLADKKDGNMGLKVYGSYSPASAASDEGTSEVKINGVVNQAGVAGKPGRGYPATKIGLTYSTPIVIGDVFVDVNYLINGEKTAQGVTSKYGATLGLVFGIESKLSDTATLRPYVRVMSVASGYSGTDQLASYNGYGLGLAAFKDVTRHFSIGVAGDYNSTNNRETNYASGAKSTSSATGYGLGLNGMFFF